MITQDHLFNYLSKKIPNFIKTRKAKTGELLFSCPQMALGIGKDLPHKFKGGLSATFIPGGHKISCLICGWKGTMYDAIRVLEPDKHNKTDAEITDYLISELNLEMYSELNIYQKYNWSLVPLLKNSKKAFEDDWRNKEYKDKIQWIKWLNNDLNIGLNCELNKLIAIDVDCKNSPRDEIAKKNREEVIKLLEQADTLKAVTPSTGSHYIFLWDEELRHQEVNLAGMQIDTRTEGQIAVAPSVINGIPYRWINLGKEIKSIPIELKTKLLELIKLETNRTSEQKESIPVPELKSEYLPKLKNNNLDGCCNDTFVSIGGMLIKQLSPEHTEFVLNIMNKYLLENPMPSAAIKAMLNSLSDYKGSDEESEKSRIEVYCKTMMTDIKADDIVKSVFKGNYAKRAIIDKYLSEFRKEGWLLRVGIGRYQCKEKVLWTKEIPPPLIEVPYTMPLFNDISVFEDGDLLLLGARTNAGKSTISLNIMKEMIKQNITPYYLISGEAGSRWQKTADALDITGKFYRYFHQDPLQIELEYNAFTIIDWLHFDDKSQVDVVLKHLNDELQRKRGILIIFTQLKDNESNDWFAPNLVHHYPTFAARYMQDNPEKTLGHWQIDKVKEMRGNQLINIVCEYNPETKVFKKKDLI